MPKVFVPHKGSHDYTKAKAFGDLIFLTEGLLFPRKVDLIYQQCLHGMIGAEMDDFLVVSGLPIVVSVASSILAERFGRVNYLIWAGSDYVKRELVIRRKEYEQV
jgi:hypothetical protein